LLIVQLLLHEKNYDAFRMANTNVVTLCVYDGLSLPSSLLMDFLQHHDYHMTDVKLTPTHLYKRNAAVFPSISEQIELERKAWDQNLRLTKLSNTGELAAGISHELRNPITIMKGYLQMIDKGGNLDDKSSRYLQTISNELDKVEQISSEFLDLAKPYLGEEKNINISQVVEDMKELMEPQSVQQGVNIHTEIDHPEIIIGCDGMK